LSHIQAYIMSKKFCPMGVVAMLDRATSALRMEIDRSSIAADQLSSPLDYRERDNFEVV
jgi:hypothetical protein